MTEVKYKAIGIIHSPFKEPKGTPIQPSGAKGIGGTVEVFPEYAEGLFVWTNPKKKPKSIPVSSVQK